MTHLRVTIRIALRAATTTTCVKNDHIIVNDTPTGLAGFRGRVFGTPAEQWDELAELSAAVERDGNFNATATLGPDAGGQTYSERLEGRFTATGFPATLRVDVSPRNCRFTRSWTAVKQGAPNVFP